MISDEYRELNVDAHLRYPGYGTKGYNWAERVVELATVIGAVTVLDYGCGKGTLKVALSTLAPDIDVREYDPGVPGKDTPPEPADLVVCTDVLEHVEPEHLNAVIADLERLALRAALVAVACRKGNKVLADGSTEHRTVQKPKWWAGLLAGWEYTPPRRSKEYAAIYWRS